MTIIILYTILIIYIYVLLTLIFGFTKIKVFKSNDLIPKNKFSIIVPFRNEAENLPILIESLSKLNYPNDYFEVVLVDDASDISFQIPLSDFKITLIDSFRKSKSPKKDAIEAAIKIAKNDWIITTDADCVVPENWLLTLDNYIQKNDVLMLVGAVNYSCQNSFLHHFQQLDLMSLQGATIGSFGIGKGFMCNGANFCYKKAFFKELNGFEDNNQIASGDDVFLLQKAILSNPEKVHYLKSTENIVTTKPLDDWKSLFYQRVRWASKTSAYQSDFGKYLALIIFVGNFSTLFVMVSLFFNHSNFILLLIWLLLKCGVDSILLVQTNAFLSPKKMNNLFLSSLFYPFFTISVALFSLFGKYEWKGRTF